MEKVKKIKDYLLAFLLPFVVCLAILYFKGVFDDVERVFVTDLNVQHFSFFNYLKDVLLGKSSLFYTFNAGMGSPMLATIVFYCLSPVNLLLLLIKDVRYAILFIYVVKICLSGLTMFILLKNRSNGNSNFVTVLFSTCYALSAFVISYFFCIFWFDSLYLAPLVTLGIDRMFKEEKLNLLYIISLALAIICNIQMGFGLCVYLVVYFLYSFSINYSIKKDLNKFKQIGLIFAISSLCAGAISSGALLGFASAYADISSAREITVTTFTATSNLFYVLKNMFTVGNLKADYYNNYEPFVYCGLIVSFLSIMYLFNKDLEKKKRFAALCVILVFVISFSVNFLNLFWHLSAPIMLNYRYAIYLGLFLTTLAYEYYVTKDKFVGNDIVILSIFLIIGFSMIVFFSNEVYVLWTSLFLVLIFSLLILVKNKSKKFEILLFIAVIAEIFLNGYLSIYTTDQIINSKYGTYYDLVDVGNLNEFSDDYRVLYNYTYTEYANDPLLINRHSSLRYFSSVIDGDLLKFYYKNVSAGGNNNYMTSAYDSPLLLSLLGNKYFYLTDELYNNIYNKVDSYKIDNIYNYFNGEYQTKDLYLYENPYALSLGYVIQNDVSFEDGMSLVDYQNAIIKGFTGNDNNVMINLEYSYSDNSEQCINSDFYACRTYTINNNTDNLNIYTYAIFDEFYVENRHKVYMDVGRPVIISTVDKDVIMTIYSSTDIYEEDFAVSTYDKNSLVNNLTTLQEDMLENVNINQNVLTGEIDSSKSGILFLSIPYDENFKIYVDGEEVEYYSLLDNTFIGLDIVEGNHDIKVEYIEKNFIWYVVATVCSVIVTLVLYFIINKTIKKKKIEAQKILEELEAKRAKNREKKKQKNKRK